MYFPETWEFSFIPKGVYFPLKTRILPPPPSKQEAFCSFQNMSSNYESQVFFLTKYEIFLAWGFFPPKIKQVPSKAKMFFVSLEIFIFTSTTRAFLFFRKREHCLPFPKKLFFFSKNQKYEQVPSKRRGFHFPLKRLLFLRQNKRLCFFCLDVCTTFSPYPFFCFRSVLCWMMSNAFFDARICTPTGDK